MTKVTFKFREGKPQKSSMNVKELIIHADDDGLRFEFVESQFHSTITPKLFFNPKEMEAKE